IPRKPDARSRIESHTSFRGSEYSLGHSPPAARLRFSGMKAVILAGGMGARMRPLTYLVPKVLLPVGAKPLLERTIDYLKTYGITEIVVCVAYLKRQIIDSFGDGSRMGVKIEYAEADLPLGTAGQLKTAESFMNGGAFLAMN